MQPEQTHRGTNAKAGLPLTEAADLFDWSEDPFQGRRQLMQKAATPLKVIPAI